jgi:prepilin-type N-terminal cleavage/methylation domain-containing protein
MKVFFNSKAFSLVEMMIVIAIISLLAVVGIPQYTKFKIKAHEAEAKTTLSALYTSLKSFHLEYGFYHTSIDALGFGVEGKMFYNIGFGSPTVAVPATYGFSVPVNDAIMSTKEQCVGANATGTDSRCRMQFDVPDIPVEATTSATQFIAAAVSTPSLYTQIENSQEGGISLIAKNLLFANDSLAANIVVPPTVLYCGPAPSLCGGQGPETYAIAASTNIWTINEKKTFKTRK